MNKVKPSAVAGKFYTSGKEELVAQIETFSKNFSNHYEYRSRAVIVPHAGYYYSGMLAYSGIKHLKKDVKNVFIIAPTHYVGFEGLALSKYESWETPLGEIEVSREINNQIIKKFYYSDFLDEAFESEHSVEVQVPFIQSILPGAKIIPILVGQVENEKISKLIDYFWDDKENAFVISSDLSHFLPAKEARKVDNLTAEMIETADVEKFNREQACGSGGVCGLTGFVKDRGFSLVRVGMYNSGDVTGDNSKVVGYGSWFLYEGGKTHFIKKYFSDLLMKICKKSILAGIEDKEPDLDYEEMPPVLFEKGACFVTLEKHGSLRGCIGSIVAHQSLIEDLVKNAYNAAFSDPRFMPVEADEFNDLSIAISLLSAPEKMTFKDEDDLLTQIVQGEDGIIIKDGMHQAVYLPSVWEQLPDKKMFLNSLKQKAGLSATHFSETFEAFRYKTEYVK